MDSKVIAFAEKQAAHCRLMGNTRRLLILWLISKEELSVNEIAAHAGSTLQNVSQHLNMLKKTGMVTARREGQTIYYRIADHESARNCPALLRAPDKLE